MTGVPATRARRLAARAAAVALLCAAAARAADDPATEPLLEAQAHRASCNLSWVSWATRRVPGNSLLARFEALTGSSYDARTEARVDCALDAAALHVDAKPRFALEYRYYRDRPETERDETEADAYLNEGEVAWSPVEPLRLSVERRALDWGPSTIYSPSNPFGKRDARLNPVEESPGRDFAAARWFPDETWTLTALGNVGAGRAVDPDFHPTAILKLDHARDATFASLVLSQQEGADARAGGYLVGSLSRGARAWVEASFARADAEAVGGLAWTFDAGGTLSGEFFFNESGSPGGDAAAVALRRAPEDSRDFFLRERYLMVQWADADVRASWDYSLRALHCLDDGSSALVGYAEAGFGDHLRLFVFGLRTFGGAGDEFPAVLGSQISAGAEYAF